MRHFPVVAIVGPRQSGKSTLARKLISGMDGAVHLDLERPSDLAKLNDPELYFGTAGMALYCLDEIQRKPELFPVIRTLVDAANRNGQFLMLGSASRDLLKQSSETLAGRIAYVGLSPLLVSELAESAEFSISRYIERGGFPRSFLEDDPEMSAAWRDNFISTFLNRDLSQWKSFTPATMERMWRMLAHNNGQTVNYSALSSSLDVSNVTVKNYIDLLASTYMLDIVPPWHSNLGKRLIKAPKVYVADSGIAASLLGLRGYDSMVAHPAIGGIWEQIVLRELKAVFPNAEFAHYRTAKGAEVDFVVRNGQDVFCVECKFSLSPKLSRGFHSALDDIRPRASLVVTPGGETFPMGDAIEAVGITKLAGRAPEMAV
ncbi:MAG: ATP-binding protein [Clostridiales Family XIII bacterium]|nr:ATP-binding protein [Clostridiales Family XIII bacterium]